MDIHVLKLRFQALVSICSFYDEGMVLGEVGSTEQPEERLL